MSNNNKHTLVPKLRFPEFQNDGGVGIEKVGGGFGLRKTE